MNDQNNRGAIWKNEKRTKETDADFTGSLDIDGKQYWVNAWRRKDGAAPNAPALKFTVRPKHVPRPKPDPLPADTPLGQHDF